MKLELVAELAETIKPKNLEASVEILRKRILTTSYSMDSPAHVCPIW